MDQTNIVIMTPATGVILMRGDHISQQCVCWFVLGLSSLSIFTHMEMSPLPVKGCEFWPMLGTHGHWAVRVLWRATPTVTRDIRLWWSSSGTSDTRTYYRAFSFYTFCVDGLDSNTQPSACGANALIQAENTLFFFLIFLSTPNHRPIKPQYKIMMTEGGSTKIIYFMTPEIYVLVMGRGHSSYTLKMHKSCSLLLGIYQTNWTKFHHPQGREFVKIL